MRNHIKKFIASYLFLLTRLILILRKPTIIVVAGSTNKTLVKKAIVSKLKHKFNVRANPRQWNAELGLPLSILFIRVYDHSFAGWAEVLFRSFFAVWQSNFPKYLVLELGFNRPGDMNFLFRLLKPQIAVITNAQPVYMENFNDDINELLAEFKILMLLVLKNRGKIVINNSLADILMAESIINRQQVIRYSLYKQNDPKCSWQIDGVSIDTNWQTFNIIHKNEIINTTKTKIPGESPREAELVAEIIASITT